MRLTSLLIPSALLFQIAGAQTGPASLTPAQANVTISASAAPPSTTAPTEAAAPANAVATEGSAAAPEGQIAIMDYQSVYDAATVEEEVKMAGERFSLSASQKEMWHVAAVDRRAAEKVAKDKLASNAANYEKDGIYRGLKAAHTTFYETIIGYMSPSQKNAMESDRVILQEKNRRLAKLPPPPPPAPTVTVAPVDSSAIKEPEAEKKTTKKKKKKKAVAQS